MGKNSQKIYISQSSPASWSGELCETLASSFKAHTHLVVQQLCRFLCSRQVHQFASLRLCAQQNRDASNNVMVLAEPGITQKERKRPKGKYSENPRRLQTCKTDIQRRKQGQKQLKYDLSRGLDEWWVWRSQGLGRFALHCDGHGVGGSSACFTPRINRLFNFYALDFKARPGLLAFANDRRGVRTQQWFVKASFQGFWLF